jgi:hypothetical protein
LQGSHGRGCVFAANIPNAKHHKSHKNGRIQPLDEVAKPVLTIFFEQPARSPVEDL